MRRIICLAALATSSFVYGDTLSMVLTVDDTFQAYVSTNPASQGTLVLTDPDTYWGSIASTTVTLTPGVVNYLQVKGRDVYGNPQMFIGQFNLSGGNFRFENGTTQLVSQQAFWTMTRDGFGGTPETIRDIGPNGTGPWGFFSAISASARFIWTQEYSSGDRFFTARIVPITGTPVIDGLVNLQNFAGLLAGKSIDISIHNGSDNQSGTASLDAGGHFNFASSVPAGGYTVGIKASHWLRKNTAMNLTVAGPNTLSVSLVNGDVDGDNEITLADYAILATAFGSVDGDTNWVANADLDGDGEVTLSDYSILSTNFGQAGDD